MPELPEVQTIVNDLKKALPGKKIVSFESGFEKAIKGISLSLFKKNVVGKKITGIERTGKNILIYLDDNETILVHLKMTGQLISQDTKPKIQDANKHLHHLCFYDIRKFGTLSLIETSQLKDKFSKLGTDPLSKEFSLEKLKGLLKKAPNKPVKALLMEQGLISGIGNIYASEILFDAKIDPRKKSSSLKNKEVEKLLESIKKILKKAILMRGTSVSDYRDASGKKGSFQDVLKVYKKDGQKCPTCDTIIEKSIIGQRSTFFCPKCQK
ncbi:MAG: Formamidopyrimidine-DNA glycosylase [Candidatus Moranbacteria bacterium GW2011_GWE1_49_15]|nr:MAG: Formamidopyrimidine-DNA glycosylase [Candidatus Moranbacteria bacterium GW2011_GWE1_49_15]